MERVAEAAKQHEPSPAMAGHGRAASPAAASLPPGLELQQLAGNQAMQQLLRSGYLQAKLAISNPDDPEEREADHVAGTIMRKHAGAPCSCSPGEEMCEECQQKQSAPAIQRRASAPAAPSHVPRIVSDVLGSPGHPLDAATRAFFEPRFGHDFSNVRVHTDSHAADSARSINAHAYTAGSHIAFAPGQYSPSTDTGRSLLAHELTHVARNGLTSTGEIHRQPAADPSIKDAGAPIAGAPVNQQPNTSQASVDTKQIKQPEPPSIKQGPIGDVIVPVGDWTFLDKQSISKPWEAAIKETTLLAIPIPELGVGISLKGSAGAHANFNASFGPGKLRNVRVGLTYGQAAALAAAGLLAPTVIGVEAAIAVLAKLSFDDIRALAELDVPAHVSVDLGINGQLTAEASVLGLFKLADVAGGMDARARASADLKFGGPLGLYYHGGHLTFKFDQSLEARLGLAFQLIAFIRASLIGFHWQKSWALLDKNLGTVWTLGAPLNVKFDNGAAVSLPLNEGALSLLSLAKDLMAATEGVQNLTKTKPSGPQGPVSPPHDPSRKGEPCDTPLPIDWPRELPVPDEDLPLRRNRNADSGNEWDGDERGPAQRRMQAEIRRRRQRCRDEGICEPPPQPCFDEDSDPNAVYQAHHIHPMYLGGKDQEHNLCSREEKPHQSGHRRLDNQRSRADSDATWHACGVTEPRLSKHPTNQQYEIEDVF